MKRYLLFDSGCCQCSKIAEAIEQEAGGKLTIRSLRDPAVKELLDRERPGWKWEPMLVEEKDDKVRIYAGGAMSRRLLLVLGPRRALKILKFAIPGTSSAINTPKNVERRNFFRVAGAATVGAIVLLATSRISYAEGPTNPLLPGSGDVHKGEVGIAAWSLGIRKYQVVESRNNVTVIRFSGVSRPQKGLLKIEYNKYDGAISAILIHSGRTLNLTWSPTLSEITITSNHDYAHLLFNTQEVKWDADDETQLKVAKAYANDVKIIGAIAMDTIPRSIRSNASMSENSVESVNTVCGSGQWEHGYGNALGRSGACYKATQDVNNKCSNQYCWGCYQVLPCDCGCFPETDFFCICIASGEKCGDCPW